jgi:uncharacterized membrane protein YsdA (DUF1294 family)
MPHRSAPRKKGKRRTVAGKGASASSRGVLALAAGLVLYLLLSQTGDFHPYLAWLAAWSVTTFIFYGLDTPLMLLYVLALIGGVAGAWAGLLFFRRAAPVELKLTLVVATIVHGAIILGLTP